MATLNGAIGAVDLKALDAHDQGKFDASLNAAHAKLEGLKPLLRQAEFHLTGTRISMRRGCGPDRDR